MQTARQLISLRVVTGFPEQRLSDVADDIERMGAQYCAVIDDDTLELIGLVRFSDVAARSSTSNRILSDLMRKPPAQILMESDSADAVHSVFDTFGPQEITVVSLTGSYLGLITPESFSSWLLENERTRKRELEHLLGEQKRLMNFVEQKVGTRMAELRGAVDEFETLCLSLSHDIRVPMRSIRGFADIVAEESALLSTDSQQAINRIQDLTTKAEGLAEGLLSRARKSFGEQSRAFVAINLNEVFDDTVRFLDALVREKSATVIKRAPLHSVYAFYVPILQIFINLIGNALNHTPADRTPLVEVWTDDTPEAVILHIKDNGAGINRLQPDALFAPFIARSNSSRDGTGLGLSIVRNAANELGGRVDLSCKQGDGSLFSVTFRKRQEPPRISNPSPTSPTEPNLSSSPPN